MAHACALAYALFLWWFSTGLIFYLDGLPRQSFKWSMAGATAVFAGSLYGLWSTAGDASASGAYLAFTCGLLAWGWTEISYYLGYVTGPRKTRCQEGCGGLRHFVHAIEANLWHELAILATAGTVLAICWGQPNETGMWTFLVLWLMHLSARLNVFLGVRNVSEEFVPPHMEVLKGFLRKAPMNLLFPFSVTALTAAAAILIHVMVERGSPYEIVQDMLLLTLIGLGLIEHWFLMLPLPLDRLWQWSLSSRPKKSATERDPAATPGPGRLSVLETG
jgi:putative photosynthetic complex assembly protein 2